MFIYYSIFKARRLIDATNFINVTCMWLKSLLVGSVFAYRKTSNVSRNVSIKIVIVAITIYIIHYKKLHLTFVSLL